MPPVQSGEGPLGRPWLSRQPVLNLRPPTSSPHYSLVLCQREWEGEGDFEGQRSRKRKRKRGGEHKAEQRGGSWPAGEKRRPAARRAAESAKLPQEQELRACGSHPATEGRDGDEGHCWFSRGSGSFKALAACHLHGRGHQPHWNLPEPQADTTN